MRIYNDSQLIQKLQKDVQLELPPDLSQFLAKTGRVSIITKMCNVGVDFTDAKGCQTYSKLGAHGECLQIMIVTGSPQTVMMNSRLLYKSEVVGTRIYRVGDRVKLTSDLERLKKNQKNRGGWDEAMKRLVGRVGSVIRVHEDAKKGHSKNDLLFQFQGSLQPVVVNPASVEPFFEEFEEGVPVVCVIPQDIMQLKCLPGGHFMAGFSKLKSKVGQVSKPFNFLH